MKFYLYLYFSALPENPQYKIYWDGGHEQLITNGETFKPAFA